MIFECSQSSQLLYSSRMQMNDSANATDLDQYTVVAVAKALAITTMVVLAVVGNILVIMSVALYKKLRTFTNVLLLSMAIADFLIGLLIMPPAMLYLVRGGWTFGALTCKIWLTLDVLLCTASILNLCVISIDRYFAILYPLRYMRQRTHELSICLIAGVWALSSVICTPPWFVNNWGFTENSEQCSYVPTLSYRIYSALGSFYVPTFVMLFVYYRILRVASKREKSQCAGGSQGSSVKNNSIRSNYLNVSTRKRRVTFDVGAGHDSNSVCMQESFRSDQFRDSHKKRLLTGLRSKVARSREKDRRHSRAIPEFSEVEIVEIEASKRDYPRIDESCYHHESFSEVSFRDEKHSHIEIDDDAISPAASRATVTSMKTSVGPNLSISSSSSYRNYRSKNAARGTKNAYQREKKALKTISIIVVGFIACWLPFFLLYVLQSTNLRLNIPPFVEQIFLWLGYSNSVLNPCIYTFYNLDFRRAFGELLFCRCCRKPSHRRPSVRILHRPPCNV